MSTVVPGPRELLLAIDRRDLTQLLPTAADDDEVPTPESGQILLEIDEFALTANNVTYATFGEALKYWSFFPHASGAGVLPVWGFATIAASAVSGLESGERIYGFFPCARWLVAEPDAIEPGGFVDAAEHRRALPAIYNGYRRVAADPQFDPTTELADMVLRPLYMTSFLIDDFLVSSGDFDAEQIVLSSASSKTALGVAFQVGGSESSRPRLVGLTSPGNVDFVAGLDLYDRVLPYPSVADDLDVVASVFVDIAGSAPVRLAVHQRLGDELKLSSAVGASHWRDFKPAGDLPGPSPRQFFAPSQFQKRAAELGTAELMQRFAGSWRRFVGFSRNWMRRQSLNGPDALAKAYREFLAGRVDPAIAFIYETKN